MTSPLVISYPYLVGFSRYRTISGRLISLFLTDSCANKYLNVSPVLGLGVVIKLSGLLYTAITKVTSKIGMG